MKKRLLQTLVLCLLLSVSAALKATTYTSAVAGAWTTSTNWSPNGVPSNSDVVIITKAMTRNGFTATDWGSGTITINSNGSLTINGALSLTGSGFDITVNSGGTLTVTGALTLNNQSKMKIAGGTLSAGAFTVDGATFSNDTGSNASVSSIYTSNSGGTDFSNTGVMNVSGSVSAYGYIRLFPGTNSTMTVGTTLTVDANPYMVVGTNTASPCGTLMTQYANLIVKGSVNLNGSGDVTVNQNGRFVVFGNVTTNGTGNLITLSCGAQAYVHGNINIGTGGGNTVTNSNGATSPTGTNGQPVIGLYVNGSVTAQNVSGTVGTQAQMDTNDKAFYTFVAGIPGSPLPVKLQYFKVTSVTEQGIALEWATSMEKNFNYFEVQSAGTDLEFKTIGIVQGRGGLQVKTVYEWLDQSPANGKNYYRLKAVDLDNSAEYFSVIVADWSGDINGLTLYPNPAIDRSFTIDLGDEYNQSVNLVIYESKGVVVYAETLLARTSAVKLPETIPSGIYFVRVASQSTQQVVRLVVK
jgi:hypothetical protein